MIGAVVGAELPSALLIRQYRKRRSKDPIGLDVIFVVTSHDSVRVIRKERTRVDIFALSAWNSSANAGKADLWGSWQS